MMIERGAVWASAPVGSMNGMMDPAEF